MFDPRYFEWLQLNHPEAEIPGDTLYPFNDDMDPEQLSEQGLEYIIWSVIVERVAQLLTLQQAQSWTFQIHLC